MYNYRQAEWKNDIFDFSNDKVTVEELLNKFIECCNSINQVLELEEDEIFPMEKVICDIVNESEVSKSEFYGGKIYPTQVMVGNTKTFYGNNFLRDNNNHFYRGFYPYNQNQNYNNLNMYSDTYFMINLQDVWTKNRNLERVSLNYREDCKYAFPNIFIGMREGKLYSVISSIPDDVADYYGRRNEVLSAVPEEVVKTLIKYIKDNADRIESVCKANDKTQGLNEEEDINAVLIKNYGEKKDFIERRRELLAFATDKFIKLDNGMYIQFELNDYAGTFSIDNVAINVYDQEKRDIDRIEFNTILDDLHQSKVVLKNRKYDYTLKDINSKETKKEAKNIEKLLKYKTSSSVMLPFIDIINDEGLRKAQQQKRIADQKREYQRRYEQSVKLVEDKKREEEQLKERFKEQQEDLAESVRQIEQNKIEIPTRSRENIDKQTLCDYDDDRACFVIKPEFRDSLKYFNLPYDLENVDMTNTDLRLVSIPNVSGIKDHNFEGCKLSENMGLLGAMKSYDGYNFVNAELYCSEPISLRGARINIKTINSLNKEFITDSLRGSIMDQESMNYIVENAEALGIKSDITVKDLDGQDVVLHITEKKVSPEVEKNSSNQEENNSSNTLDKLINGISSEEAFVLVARLISEGKLSVDVLNQLTDYAKTQQNPEENINKSSHKR